MYNWKPIPGFEGVYDVSSCGQVRRIKSRWGEEINKILKRSLPKSGYYLVTLSKNGIQKNFSVHTLVALAFIGPIPKDWEINHKDGNKINNYFENLEIVSHKDNMKHGYLNGLICHKGEKNSFAKLTKDEVLFIRNEYENGNISYEKLGQKFGVSERCVSSIIKRRSWAHV